MRTQRLRPRARTEKEFRDAARKNRRVFVCASTHYSHLCNTDHIKPGWGVGAGGMERGCRIKKLETVKPPLFTLPKRMGDKKIKTGVGILALSALTTMMISAPALAKIEEGKLVIWINGDKGYKGLAE
ncbi:sugar ABC transporter substrate-binding protein, partial [Salmonella enterica subsp. enterica serovar Mbandaka]